MSNKSGFHALMCHPIYSDDDTPSEFEPVGEFECEGDSTPLRGKVKVLQGLNRPTWESLRFSSFEVIV